MEAGPPLYEDTCLLYTSHQKLTELQEELGEYPGFLLCHQSYLVNLEQVERLEDSCFHMKDGQVIPISRNRCV